MMMHTWRSIRSTLPVIPARLAHRSRAARLPVALLVALVALACAGIGASGDINSVQFALHPNNKFLPCMGVVAGSRGGPAAGTPIAVVTVTRGNLNDTLEITLDNFKPNLGFDLFTVQRSSLLANGTADPAFKGSFGLAWYQSDIETDSNGHADVIIKTILLDQIFGFDPDVSLSPTNTFHVGFWFNDPNDAAPCGFNVAAPTPFNGDHNAGPLAMISLPNAVTGLGPLAATLNGASTTTTTPATNGQPAPASRPSGVTTQGQPAVMPAPVPIPRASGLPVSGASNEPVPNPVPSGR